MQPGRLRDPRHRMMNTGTNLTGSGRKVLCPQAAKPIDRLCSPGGASRISCRSAISDPWQTRAVPRNPVTAAIMAGVASPAPHDTWPQPIRQLVNTGVGLGLRWRGQPLTAAKAGGA